MERKQDEIIAILQMQNEALQAIFNILQPPQQPPPYKPPQPKEEQNNDLPQLKPVEQPKSL